MKPLRTVFFDMGNTLLEFHQGRSDDEKDELGLQALTAHLQARCGRIELEAVRGEFFAPWAECFPKRLETLQEYPVEDYLTEFLLPYGVTLQRDEIVLAMDVFHGAYREELAWEVGLAGTLSTLKDQGLKIGVISNCYLFDEINVRHFQHAGLDSLVDAYTFSYSLGLRKPRPEIFAAALARTGADPAASLMVGDSLKADVEGAQRAGLRALWFNPSGGENTTQIVPDGEVRRLAEVPSLVATWSQA